MAQREWVCGFLVDGGGEGRTMGVLGWGEVGPIACKVMISDC